MMKKVQYDPIFITGVERSGSTLIARILDACGVHSGYCNGMFEHVTITEFNNDYLKNFPFNFPKTEDINIPIKWKGAVEGVLTVEQALDKPWMIKSGTLTRMWPIWNYAYPDAKWLIIRRRTGDVIQSCLKTGYMRTFKIESNLESLGFIREEEGWLWWIHEYEKKFIEMMQAGLNCRVIWPERMVTGNYQQIYETIEWLGLKWNNDIPKVIDPLLNKSREVFYEDNS
jgi:hypothetical protein